MGTKIEWTDVTWNPVTGCRKVSPGCQHCYAERFAARGLGVWGRTITAEGADGYPKDYHDVRPFTEVRCHPERLDAPLRWRKPRRVFVNSMSDLFHEDVPDEFIHEVFWVMGRASRHTFQVLTKRPERMRGFLTGFYSRQDDAEAAGVPGTSARPWPPLPNVWLGVSVEDQQRADERVPLLLDTPAAVRFVSAEPLLGSVNLTRYLYQAVRAIPGVAFAYCPRRDRLDWIIVGGESGPGARPMDLAWARSLVVQGRAAGVATFVKQLGARPVSDSDAGWGINATSSTLRDRRGGDPEEWPPDLRVREWPS